MSDLEQAVRELYLARRERREAKEARHRAIVQAYESDWCGDGYDDAVERHAIIKPHHQAFIAASKHAAAALRRVLAMGRRLGDE